MKLKTLMIAAALFALASCCDKAPQKTIELPFQGNTYVTQMNDHTNDNAAAVIDTRSGLVRNWNTEDVVLSLYFKTSVVGNFSLNVRAANPEGTEASTLAFTCDGKTRKIKVVGNEMTDYCVGKFKVAKPGYVKVDIQGLSATPEGAQYARIEKYDVTGSAVADTCNCFAESRAVCIIIKVNGLADSFFKHFFCGNLVEIKVICKFNVAV